MTAKYAVITKPAHIHVEHAADIFGHLKAGGTSPLGIIWAGLKLLCGAELCDEAHMEVCEAKEI